VPTVGVLIVAMLLKGPAVSPVRALCFSGTNALLARRASMRLVETVLISLPSAIGGMAAIWLVWQAVTL
jgi:hypothetical protein